MDLPGFPAGVRRALFVHAHPDDETLSTGGMIALLAASGTPVTLVTCTRGERGEVVAGPLAPLEGTPMLAPHRAGELARAVAVLGIAHAVFLGHPPARAQGQQPRVYTDSGMQWAPDGTAIAVADAAPDAFTRAAFDDPLADLLAEVDRAMPDLIVSYDEIGGYGHPDHRRAAELARAAAAERGIRFIAAPSVENERAGDVRIDVTPVLEVKRAALAEHASQLTLTDAGYTLSGGQQRPLPSYELLRL